MERRLQAFFEMNNDQGDESGGENEGSDDEDINIDSLNSVQAFILQMVMGAQPRRRSPRQVAQAEAMELEERISWRNRMRENEIVSEICSRCNLPSPYAESDEEAGVAGPPSPPHRVIESWPGQKSRGPLRSLTSRELGLHRSMRERLEISSRMIPSRLVKVFDEFPNNVYCGTFSPSGAMYMAASQDGTIRIYDAAHNFERIKEIRTDVGWTIVDTDYSPNQQFVICSTWSTCVQLFTAFQSAGTNLHLELDFAPPDPRFCLFSVKFSHDSAEIVGGGNDNSIYVYDVTRRQRVLRVPGHRHDVNAVAFADGSSNLIISGSDDRLCKLWDRRALGTSNSPVGVFAGHTEGITYIDPKGDGTYFISNGKDHRVRLWDVRKMGGQFTQPERSASNNDYRMASLHAPAQRARSTDMAVMSYRGHTVSRTLIRSKWSPLATTGQRYIYSGSSDGRVFVWDALTGEVVKRLNGHRQVGEEELQIFQGDLVRDVAWHPTRPILMATRFSGAVDMYAL